MLPTICVPTASIATACLKTRVIGFQVAEAIAAQTAATASPDVPNSLISQLCCGTLTSAYAESNEEDYGTIKNIRSGTKSNEFHIRL